MPKILSVPLFLLVLIMVPGTTYAVQGQAISDSDNGHIVKSKTWGIEFEAPHFEHWNDHPLQEQANFVLAGKVTKGSCELNRSMFAIPITDGTTPHECRSGYMGNPDGLANRPEIELHEHQVSPITFTLYDWVLGEGSAPTSGLRQNQLYGYWVRRDVCFEIHISSMSCSNFAPIALPILNSVKIDEDIDVTTETVALAQEMKGGPGDWIVHLATASKYLHGMNPSVPVRARRFYESALELGGDLEDQYLWIIHEGIGLTWLEEDSGQEAIPPLEKALSVARQMPENKTMLSSTLYNISCAYSLTNQIGLACENLEELISNQSGKELKSTLKEIKKDKQLRIVRKSPCYKELLSRKK